MITHFAAVGQRASPFSKRKSLPNSSFTNRFNPRWPRKPRQESTHPQVERIACLLNHRPPVQSSSTFGQITEQSTFSIEEDGHLRRGSGGGALSATSNGSISPTHHLQHHGYLYQGLGGHYCWIATACSS
jgi:hypothetical protein